MIKPHDVPESLVENYADRFSLAYWDGAKDEHVAEFLNAAIEAGVVSPPCYCVRWDGELQTHSKACSSTGLIQPRVFAGKPFSHDTEHYRGQTE